MYSLGMSAASGFLNDPVGVTSGGASRGPPRGVKVVEFLKFRSPDGDSDSRFTMKVEVGLLAGPPADGLAESSNDRHVEAPEVPRRPLGNGG